MKQNFKKRYRDLEMQVLNSLNTKIEKSKDKSNFMDCKVLKITLENYIELAIINDQLTLIDSYGQHFSVFTINLESLINLI